MPHRLAWRFAWALSALLLHGAVNCSRSQTPDGAIEVVAHTGSLATRDSFGSVQLYVEWATPAEVAGKGQERGNGGQAAVARGTWRPAV